MESLGLGENTVFILLIHYVLPLQKCHIIKTCYDGFSVPFHKLWMTECLTLLKCISLIQCARVLLHLSKWIRFVVFVIMCVWFCCNFTMCFCACMHSHYPKMRLYNVCGSLFYKIWLTVFTFIMCFCVFCVGLACFRMHGVHVYCMWKWVKWVCVVLALCGSHSDHRQLCWTLSHGRTRHKLAAEQVASSGWHEWSDRDAGNKGRDAQHFRHWWLVEWSSGSGAVSCGESVAPVTGSECSSLWCIWWTHITLNRWNSQVMKYTVVSKNVFADWCREWIMLLKVPNMPKCINVSN